MATSTQTDAAPKPRHAAAPRAIDRGAADNGTAESECAENGSTETSSVVSAVADTSLAEARQQIRHAIATNASPAQFWEAQYERAKPTSTGRPTAALAQFVVDGSTALELGCGKGDDAVWLARRGYRVTAVDISSKALEYATANATRAGVQEAIEFQRHDLAETFPDGQFDFVTALFLQSPVSFPRLQVLRRAAQAVAPGGSLLVVEHGSRAPWSWAAADTVYPSAAERLASLALGAGWNERFVGPHERMANGPAGRTAKVTENVILLERAKNPGDNSRVKA